MSSSTILGNSATNHGFVDFDEAFVFVHVCVLPDAVSILVEPGESGDPARYMFIPELAGICETTWQRGESDAHVRVGIPPIYFGVAWTYVGWVGFKPTTTIAGYSASLDL